MHIPQGLLQVKRLFISFFLFLFVVSSIPLSGFTVVEAVGERTITTLAITNQLSEARQQAPVTWSVPLQLSEQITNPATLSLVKNGQMIPAQFTPIARWDGDKNDSTKPIMWVLVDTQVTLAPNETLTFDLIVGPAKTTASALQITQNYSQAITIATGAATYTISKTNFRFFDRVVMNNGSIYAGDGGMFYNGSAVVGPVTIQVEHEGSERISLWVQGTLQDGLAFTARMHFYKNLSEVRVDFRLENNNPTPTTEFGQPQANNYGSVGSVRIEDFSVLIPGTAEHAYTIPTGELGSGGMKQGTYTNSVVITQESSGDSNWSAMKNVGYTSRLQNGVTQRASSETIDGVRQNGPNQIAGWMSANGVGVAVEHAWQNFPKSFRAKNTMVEIGLFPGEFAQQHELRAGEYKTHTFFVQHGSTTNRLASALSPLRLLPPLEYTIATQAAGLFGTQMETTFADYEKGVDYQITPDPSITNATYLEGGAVSVLDAMSKAQTYGWVDYGNIPLDFEKNYSIAGGVAFTPYNLKYDALRGMILQALRHETNETWWELARAGAIQSADGNMQHSPIRGYNTPRAWFDGGMYGHGYHNENGQLNPGRNYMNPSSSMAGPGPGMILWALMTGDTLLMDSGLELADNLYWKTSNSHYGEGAAIAQAVGLQICANANTCSGYEPVEAGRTAGNVIGTMQMAYMATGDREYLNLISRIANYFQRTEIEVQGGIASCDRHHFQTTFIRNLGHYLLLRQQLNLSTDTGAKLLLERRMNDMTGRLWNEATGRVYMCYDGGAIRADNYSGSWQVGAADAFAVGALVLNRPELVDTYGRRVFTYGALNAAWDGSGNHYNATKEFVNQVGFGNYFLYAWQQLHGKDTLPTPSAPVDADADGYPAATDCNDANAAVHPGATEIPGNGIDDDCTSNTSDVVVTPPPAPIDPAAMVIEAETMNIVSGSAIELRSTDAAFYGTGATRATINVPQSGDYRFIIIARADLIPARQANLRLMVNEYYRQNTLVTTNEFAPYEFIRPLSKGANRRVTIAFTNDYNKNGQDLNLYIDKIIITPVVPTPVDVDRDGYAAPIDCNDANAAVHPGATEIPYDGSDNDCTASTRDNDLDGDGVLSPHDCNDANSAIHPNATEILSDGYDNDCNPETLDEPPVLPPQAQGLELIQDTSLWAEANTNMGAMQTLMAMRTHEDAGHALMQFSPLENVPQQARALLKLFYLGGESATGQEICLSAITSPWAEGTGTHEWASADGATWTESTSGVQWQLAGGDHGPTIACVSLPAQNGVWISFDITNSIAQQQFGYMLTTNSGEWWRANFASGEYNDTTLRPQIVIE